MQVMRHLFAVLSKNIIKLLHQLIVDGISRADVLEFQQQVKGCR